MKIVIIEELFERGVIIEFKGTTTTIKGKSFKQNIQKDWRGGGSRQQEENKYKYLFHNMNEWREGRKSHQST